MKILKVSTLLLASGALLFASCKKNEPEMRDEKIGGCLDENSPAYNDLADFDDESCVYAYVNAYEITYHPANDASGDDWDFLLNTDADIYLKIMIDGDTEWLFESPTFCLLYTSPSPRDRSLSRMPSSA